MPAILKTAYKNRNKTPEFVGYMWLSRYLNIPTPKLRSSGILDDIPFRYDKSNKKLFKYTAAMDAIAKYRVSPPDNLHPLHEFSQAEAMIEMGLKPEQLTQFIRAGKLRTHISQVTGHSAIYRQDIDRFYREWFPEHIVSNITMPVRRATASILIDVKLYNLKRKTREGELSYEPRKRKDPYRYSKTELLKYLRRSGRRWFRRNPLPDYLTSSVAAIYMGITDKHFANLRMMGIVKLAENPVGTGACQYCYKRSELDDAIDIINARTYYCEGMNYYTRRAIKYKFLKSERWVDEFIAGKCRRVMSKDEIAPATGPVKAPPKGWLKEDVERIVASGVEVKIRKKHHLSFTRKKLSSIVQLATPPVLFANPVEQMEAAIAASIKAGKEASILKKREALKKVEAESAKLNAIRNILTGGPATRQSRPSRNDMLRFAEERPIVTILFSTTGMRGKYDEYPNSKEECLFRVSSGISFGRRKIPPSFARAIMNALKIYKKQDVRLTPSWVVLVSATSIITDPTFHRTLAQVPEGIGAVAPFGYEYLLPDGSWDRCPVSYGTYGMYSEITGARQRVDGITDTFGAHRVAVMDGPFVAIRGEYLAELGYISFFQQLGDQRGLLGPVVSGICRKFGIPMMQVSVESWSSIEYFVRPNTPEMNLAVERIANFVERPIERLEGK